MAPDDGGTDYISRLNDLASVDTDNLSQSVTKLVLLPIVAFFGSMAAAVEAGADVVILPLRALAEGAAGVLDGLLGGGGDIIEAGAQATAAGTDVFGILAYPIGIAIVLAGAYLLAAYLSEEETSDLLPFTTTDIPFLGSEEEG
jgi:hypothetical protein